MSDLHRAVEAEIDSFRPDRTPPFSDLLARRRTRSRRRNTVGAAALTAVAVAGIVLVPSALSGGEDRLPAATNSAPPQGEPASELAARLCADAAEAYDGEVALVHGITVQEVRDYLADPHGTAGDPAAGPVPGPFSYPDGWAGKAAGDPAAACYIDAAIPRPGPAGSPPADRALVMVADGAVAFLATAGPKEHLPLIPLTQTSTPDSPSSAEATRYSVTYDSEASYAEHADAVQACLRLPGTSDASAEFSMPPRIGVAVTGVGENRAFQACVSSLAGVTVTAQVPYDRPVPSTPSPG